MDYCELLFFAKYTSGPFNQEVFRTCTCYELLYISKGSGTFYFEGRVQNVFDDNIILIPPNSKFRFVTESSGEYFISGFTYPNQVSYDKPLIYNGKGTQRVRFILNLMYKELKDRSFCRKIMLNLLFNVLTINLLRLQNSGESKKIAEQDNFDFIIHFLDAQSQNCINIEEIAKMSGLSYHRFRHKFKEITGTSPQQYIIKKRITFAEKLLKNTSYNTSAIAKACGFNSVPQFITCFNKQEGITPVRYRKQFRNKQINK